MARVQPTSPFFSVIEGLCSIRSRAIPTILRVVLPSLTPLVFALLALLPVFRGHPDWWSRGTQAFALIGLLALALRRPCKHDRGFPVAQQR